MAKIRIRKLEHSAAQRTTHLALGVEWEVNTAPRRSQALLLPRAILPHPVDAFSATLSNYSLSGSAGHEGHGGSERVRGALQHIFMWDWDSDGHDGIRSHAGAEERTMLFTLIQHERERRISLYRE